jgi:dienelactone hydrolase
MRRIALALLLAASCAPKPNAALPVLHAAGAKIVEFRSLDGDITIGRPTTVPALLFRAAGKGKHGAVVALPDCAGVSESDTAWAREVAASGYSVIIPDSFGPRGVRDGCSDTHVVTKQRWRDAYGALAFLRAQSFIAANHIAVVGWGDGALTTLAAAGKKPGGAADFRAAIAFHPACEGPLSQITYAPAIPLYVFTAGEPSASCAELARRRLEIKLAPSDGSAELQDLLFKHLSAKS